MIWFIWNILALHSDPQSCNKSNALNVEEKPPDLQRFTWRESTKNPRRFPQFPELNESVKSVFCPEKPLQCQIRLFTSHMRVIYRETGYLTENYRYNTQLQSDLPQKHQPYLPSFGCDFFSRIFTRWSRREETSSSPVWLNIKIRSTSPDQLIDQSPPILSHLYLEIIR